MWNITDLKDDQREQILSRPILFQTKTERNQKNQEVDVFGVLSMREA